MIVHSLGFISKYNRLAIQPRTSIRSDALFVMRTFFFVTDYCNFKLYEYTMYFYYLIKGDKICFIQRVALVL
jgi:hypothetical protein